MRNQEQAPHVFDLVIQVLEARGRTREEAVRELGRLLADSWDLD